jgi:hypothetical protein
MAILVLLFFILIIVFLALAAFSFVKSAGESTALMIPPKKTFQEDFAQVESLMIQDTGLSNLSDNGLTNDEVYEYFNPNGGRIRGWFQEKRTAKQLEVTRNLTAMHRELLATAIDKARAVCEQKTSIANFMMYLRRNEAELKHLVCEVKRHEQAAAEGMLVDDYSKANRDRWANEDKMDQQKAQADLDHKHQQERLEKESELRMKEYTDKKETDLRVEIEHAKARMEFEIIAKHLLGHKKAALLQDQIEVQYVRIADIRKDPLLTADAKKWMEESRLGLIDMYREAQREAINGKKGNLPVQLQDPNV